MIISASLITFILDAVLEIILETYKVYLKWY